ncbi:MAG: hypothetical protein ACTJLM_05225 [Ehrlichia sp.]
MVNHVNQSSGLSFFQFLALNSDYESYENVKLSCGDVKSLTANKATLAHLCAKSAIRDSEGKFEFHSLIEDDKKLITAVDDKKAGLLAYAASGEVGDTRSHNEAVKLIMSLGEKLDGNLKKRFSAGYAKRTLLSAFTGGNKKDL